MLPPGRCKEGFDHFSNPIFKLKETSVFQFCESGSKSLSMILKEEGQKKFWHQSEKFLESSLFLENDFSYKKSIYQSRRVRDSLYFLKEKIIFYIICWPAKLMIQMAGFCEKNSIGVVYKKIQYQLKNLAMGKWWSQIGADRKQLDL